MDIPFYHFKAIHDSSFQKSAASRISKILSENSFIEGEYNQKLEQSLKKRFSTKHCLLVANGTDALEISLKAHGVNYGDKVGVPGITFYATAEAILNVGAEPVFIDVDPDSGLICPQSLSRIVQSHTLKFVMPVHIYGLPAPIHKIEEICLQNKITIIEDAAQAFGASYENDQLVGHGNHATTFSFYPTKNFSAFGDAGAICTNDDELANEINLIRNHGRGKDGWQKVGRNSRCDHIQAAILHLKIDYIDEWNKSRRQIANWYFQELADFKKILFPDRFIPLSSWHLFPIKLSSSELRISLAECLKQHGIGSAPFYEKSLSQETVLSHYDGETKNAEEMAGKILCLPIFPYYKKEQISQVTKTVKQFLSNSPN